MKELKRTLAECKEFISELLGCCSTADLAPYPVPTLGMVKCIKRKKDKDGKVQKPNS